MLKTFTRAVPENLLKVSWFRVLSQLISVEYRTLVLNLKIPLSTDQKHHEFFYVATRNDLNLDVW